MLYHYYADEPDVMAIAGLYVAVTPVIQEDDFVSLDISPRVTDLTGWSPKGVPIVFERSLHTAVKVRDGKTYVLGGLRRTEKVEKDVGVPVLHKMPVLGRLFGSTRKTELERDVVIFITPHILAHGEALPSDAPPLPPKLGAGG